MTDKEKVLTGWTDGRPFVATNEHLKMAWNGHKNGAHFRCGLCGLKFQVGDTVRWQFTNDTPGAGGNPFVCTSCDKGRDGNIAEILARRAELKADKWWWFLPKESTK